MRILSLDTATEVAACAVIENNNLLGETILNYKKQHSVILMPMIDSLLKNLNLSLKDIDGFVVSKGPGSFTGLRIGMATIKGLSQGTKKPFVSVSTLDALAYNMCYTSGIICPVLDALRGNVYTALYTFEGSTLKQISDHMVVSVEELITILSQYNQPVCFIGDGIQKNKELLNSIDKVSFAPSNLNIVRASSLGELGLQLLSQGVEESLHNSGPVYLRKSQAERELDKKMENNNHE